ncbi:META domain-containing protein [Streptomyces kunmingensis]|uniref:META domain-containing protein n=1 Tax=Streptomyces kunmingensis TaxID=68225 RepID=A0ABU6CLL9_9ACTN|nr:META domain-containing protein [Streptomyces kunmingensis]MEB3965634.1 META domain-containing protein [Streptomyces kunmingensis]
MFTQRSTRALFTAALPLVALTTVAACGNEKAPGTVKVGGAPVAGVNWAVESVTVDGATTKAPDGAYLKFVSDERVRGNYGCNDFDAQAQVDNDSVDLGKSTTTLMGCADTEQRAFEKTLARALADKNTVKARGDDGLTLTRANGDTISLAKQPAQRDAALVGTKWTVDTLHSGDVAKSLPKAAQNRARLVFDKDGKVSARLGCNSGRAKATVKDGHITFGPLNSTRMGCVGEAADLEKAMRKVLDGKASYRIEGDGLTLIAADGTGAGFTATK